MPILSLLSIALGIGATTAVFTLANALLLRPLAVADADRLVVLTTQAAAQNGYTEQYGYATFDDLRRRGIVEDALAWSTSLFTVDGDAAPVSAMWVSGNLFRMLGVSPAAGRAIAPEDDRAGGGSDGLVAMISHRLWQRRFAGAPDVVGRTITLDRTPVTVVGVAPRGFAGIEVGRVFDLFVPAESQPLLERGAPLDRYTPYLWMVLKLRPRQTAAAATTALRAAQSDIRTATLPPGVQLPDFLPEPFVLESAAGGTSVFFDLRQRYRGPLAALLAVAALVLVVACVNVANLFLARGAARRRELSIRLALGASRARLVGRELRSAGTFAAAGSALGLVFAWWASRALVTQLAGESLLSPEVHPLAMSLPLDWRVLLFTAATAALAVVIFGVAPALAATRVDPIEALKDGGRDGTGGARLRALNGFVVVQVAVALVIVLTAGLFVRSFLLVREVPLGFDPSGMLLVTVAAPSAPVAERGALYHRLVDAAARVPGIARAGGLMGGPLTTFGGSGIGFTISGARPLPPAQRVTQIVDATPGWRAAYGIPLLRGRDFTDGDTLDALPVMIVNEAFVRRFFPGEDVVARTVTVTADLGNVALGAKTIVGVVGDTVFASSRAEAPPAMYQPLAQRTFPLFYPAYFLAARTSLDAPAALAGALTTALHGVAPDLRVTMQPMRERVEAMLTQDRVIARLSLFAGGLALLLAAVGLYGVTAYAVACRRGELGIRLALGSTPSGLVRLVVGQAARRAVLGVLIGGAVGLWSSRLAAPLLFGVAPHDPVVIAGAAIALVSVAVLAAWVPARSASRAVRVPRPEP